MDVGNPERNSRSGVREAKPFMPFSLACVHELEAQRQDEALWSDSQVGLSPFKETLLLSIGRAPLCLAQGCTVRPDLGLATPWPHDLGKTPLLL